MPSHRYPLCDPAGASDLKTQVLGRLLQSDHDWTDRLDALPPAAVVLPSGADRGNPEHQPLYPTPCFHLDSHRKVRSPLFRAALRGHTD
jgi:hypothetical protein